MQIEVAALAISSIAALAAVGTAVLIGVQVRLQRDNNRILSQSVADQIIIPTCSITRGEAGRPILSVTLNNVGPSTVQIATVAFRIHRLTSDSWMTKPLPDPVSRRHPSGFIVCVDPHQILALHYPVASLLSLHRDTPTRIVVRTARGTEVYYELGADVMAVLGEPR